MKIAGIRILFRMKFNLNESLTASAHQAVVNACRVASEGSDSEMKELEASLKLLLH